MAENNRKPHAIIIPFCYQGHITPSINLTLKLASKGFTITYVHTEFIHNLIAKAQQNATQVDIFAEARKSGLDIRYTTISDCFPQEFDRDLYFDEFWESMFRDFPVGVDELVARTIESDPFAVHFLIADTFYSWPAMIAEKYSLVNVSFWTEPATVFAIDYHLDLLREKGHLPFNGHFEDQVDYIPGVEPISKRDLMSYLQDEEEVTITLLKIVIKGFDQVKKADFILCNTVHELESKTLSAINKNHPTYAIGPINFDITFSKTTAKSLWSESDCSEWLDSKPSGSVLYISFGSIAQSNKQDIGEIANGLLLSGVNFIWILRPDIAGPDETDVLPDGFNDHVKDRGLIIPWCD